MNKIITNQIEVYVIPNHYLFKDIHYTYTYNKSLKKSIC